MAAMSPLLALACAALLHAACALYTLRNLHFIDDPSCGTLRIGKTDEDNPSIQKTTLKPIQLKGVPGGGVDLEIPYKALPPRKLIGEKVTACDFYSRLKPSVRIKDSNNISSLELVANVKWPSKTNLIIFVVQYTSASPSV